MLLVRSHKAEIIIVKRLTEKRNNVTRVRFEPSAVAMLFTDACAPHFGLLKILFLERHVTTRQPAMMQKGIYTFSPIYLTKVTYNSSILKFLSTESS